MRIGARFIGIALTALVLGACTSASSRFDGEMARPDRARIHVCHGFNCYHTTRLDLTEADRGEFTSIMAAGAESAAAERAAISRAVAYFERRYTEVIGVRDLPESHIGQTGQIGQMDCIDESTNTRSLLLHLDLLGLLRHHSVEANISRGLIIDGTYYHSTAVVRERSGERWAVDSWYGAGGEAPEIKPLRQWMSEGFLGQRG